MELTFGGQVQENSFFSGIIMSFLQMYLKGMCYL